MAQLQVTRTLQVTPLIDIRSAPFAESYQKGLCWRMLGWREHGEVEAQGPLPESFLIDHLKLCAHSNRFDGRHEDQVQKDVGYFIGMIHGGVLSPSTGHPRPEVTTLVLLHNQDTSRGYTIGRWWFFHEAEPDERRYTDERLIERLGEIVRESPHWKAPDQIWCYCIGCLFGELSGHLFPETPQEGQVWEADQRKWLAIARERTTEASPGGILQEA